jgi:hypothetical protein
MNYAIEILLEQKTLIESELVHTESEERTKLERRLIDTANALNTLNLPIVSNRRELLNALADEFNDSTHTYVGQPLIEKILKAFNCG